MSTLAEIFESIKSDAHEKGRSSFFGAFAISWSLRNWELVFALFNFDKDFTLDDKIASIKFYLDDNSICGNLLVLPILYAFGGIIVFYLLNYASKAISLFYNRKAIPLLSDKIKPHDMVERSIYDSLDKKYKNIEEKHLGSLKIQSDLEDQIRTNKTQAEQEFNNYKTPVEARDEFLKIFRGKWIEGMKGNEPIFHVNYNGEFIEYITEADQKVRFKIENIRYYKTNNSNNNQNQLLFDKVSLDNNKRYQNSLAQDPFTSILSGTEHTDNGISKDIAYQQIKTKEE